MTNTGKWGDAIQVFMGPPFNDDHTFENMQDFAVTAPDLHNEFQRLLGELYPDVPVDDREDDVTESLLPQYVPEWMDLFHQIKTEKKEEVEVDLPPEAPRKSRGGKGHSLVCGNNSRKHHARHRRDKR